jgi:gamma-glutamyltranspeptidase
MARSVSGRRVDRQPVPRSGGAAPALIAPLTPAAQQSGPAHDRPPTWQTQRPPLHATQWLALTGKPLAATAGAMMFQKGGNAVDAAAAMLAATCTMWDVLSWGGETQALIYDPRNQRVIGINALGGGGAPRRARGGPAGGRRGGGAARRLLQR